MSATRRRLRRPVVQALFRLFKSHVSSRAWTDAQTSGRRLGSLIWRFARRDRERALAHLRIAFPDLTQAERERLARRAFVGLGVTLAEYLHLAERGPEAAADHFDIDGWQHVEQAKREARSVLIATAHCGNWELLGPAFYRQGEELTAIVRSLEDDWMEAALTTYRAALGSRVITRGQPGTGAALLALRRRGGFLAAFIDQDIRAASVFVPFFGRPAHTPVGPAQMAVRWSMAVVPAFCERLENGRHLVRFLPAIREAEDETAITAAITRAIEEQIRRRPEQWVWMHRRWRRRPPDAAGGS